MVAIVRAKGSPYKDGTFPSGTNWEDYILWCLVQMGKECTVGSDKDRCHTTQKEAAKIDAGQKENATANDAGSVEEDLEEEDQHSSATAQVICSQPTTIPTPHYSSVASDFSRGHYGDTCLSSIVQVRALISSTARPIQRRKLRSVERQSRADNCATF